MKSRKILISKEKKGLKIELKDQKNLFLKNIIKRKSKFYLLIYLAYKKFGKGLFVFNNL